MHKLKTHAGLMQKIPDLLDFYLVIPCYNNEEGLVRSLKSIRYDPDKFSILIIDDGSVPAINYSEVLPAICPDFTFQVIKSSQNQGITKALNTGLEYLADKKGCEFVARLDCGDVCDKNRFYSQVEFLKSHPDIDLIGSWCIFKDAETGMSYQYTTPTLHHDIIKEMYFRNVFIHPTVMWRASLSNEMKTYPEQFPHAEDYGFFYKILNTGKGAVLPEKFVTCEINTAGISLLNRKEQLRSRISIIRYYGTNKLLILLGTIKLWLLLSIPYPMILKAKKVLYGV